MGRFILILHFILWGGLMAWAAQPYNPQIVNPLTEPWRWKHFPELEGKGIRHVVESADQKVWVSYNDGVLEYDGYDWKTHNQDNGLTASPVEQLLVAKDGSIYATASNGIYRYDGQQWVHFFEGPANQTITYHSIKQLRDQSVIACADWGFIHLLTNGDTRIYTSATKAEDLKKRLPGSEYILLPKDLLTTEGDMIYASDVLETNEGEVWFAVTTKMEVGKLLRFKWKDVRDGKIDHFEVIASQKDFELGEDQRMLLAADGKIWVINSTSNKGIHIYDGENWETIFINKLFGSDEYLADIVQSVNGTIWLSSMAKIFAYHQGRWAVYKAPVYPVPANRIILQNSQSDQIWVAGYKSKVLLLDFSTEQWLTYENLSFQCEIAPDEELFLERNNRLIHRKGSIWTSYGVEDGLMDAPIRVIRTSKGQIWAAGSHQGYAATALYVDGRWERHIHRELSWGIDYRAVFEARDGALWFGGAVDGEKVYGFYSGVLQLTNPEAEELTWIQHPFQENGLTQANSYGIGQSKDGKIWLGGSQLLFYNGKTWNTLPDERLQQYVNYVCSTDELLLVGSRYYGLFVYDGKTWKNYNTSSGLSGNTIISIDALSDSMIIVATENGISKFDGTSWTQDIFPERLNMDFEGGTIYHTDKYIWVNHVPRSWKRRAYQRNIAEEENGQFFTTRYRPSSKPPETSFDFFLESVSSDGNTLISWKGKDYFAKTAATRLMYAYRLNGGKWSPFTKDQQFTFTSLPSGNHILEVMARDLDFNVDPTPARIEFEVMPPIWKQAWFITLILAFLTIFLIYEYRVISKKKKLEILNESLRQANDKLKERGRKIETQNHEILAQQGQILEQSKVLERNNIDLESRNEEIRQQRDKLEDMVEQVESLSKAKLGFFTNISHELRTPITLILGPISQLIKESGVLSLEKRQQYYGTIERNASRLHKLINQLLEMRRIEHSTLELNLSDIYLANYISSMVRLFDGLALNRDIHLEFIDHSRDNITLLDSDKVEKIMVNLLSNAFKFTPEGSSITVELSTVKASERNLSPFYENYFEIIVEDTGTGMSQEIIDLIFDKYYTTGTGITGSHNSGIGLYYVKDLVYLMQGDIKVDSQLGKGTKFTIYLPQVLKKEELTKDAVLEKPALKMARQEASLLMDTLTEEAPLTASHLPDNSNKLPRVLVVEDNPDMQHFLEDILSKQYQITTANNGLEGLKMARNQSFDLILSDVMMPEMDGITFCKKIKEDFATSHLPVILLTAKAMEESKLDGYIKGADDYITKPFNPELLLVRVNNLLQQRAQLREVFNKNFMLTPKTETIASPDEEFLARLVNLMNENLSEAEFNVKSMCQSMHLSHMHFIRKVKQLTGKKPIDLLKSFRMKKAKDILAQQKLTIAEVAYMVGFDLPNSFSRSFKKEFDLTPTEFVKNISEISEYQDS